MKKAFKIFLNLTIFLLIIVFVWYMAISIGRDNTQERIGVDNTDEPFESPYRQGASFDLPEEINRFELYGDKLFVSAGQSVYVLDTEGELITSFSVEPAVSDIAFADEAIYLLYPTRISVYSADGQALRQWEACSELSDYCSFTIAGDAVFVTDAENKNISKYTTEGDFVKFINSPRGFIIPSYSFDIDVWNDTVYCVNSGRHSVETYTLNGDFIAAFGSSGFEAGSFAGCCNPVYISFTPCGTLIASEKGNPRVSIFERNGKFKEVWLNNKMLGSGNKACEVKANEKNLFVAVKNRIICFKKDTNQT